MSTGLKTLSSKLPDAPATLTATSLPSTWHAEHRQRLALGRIDLARHDRAAGLVLGNADLAEAGARPRREPAHVVGDLRQRRRERLQRAVGEDDRVVRGERLELVRRRDERQAGARRQLGRDPRAELRRRVQAGADRGAAERELAQVRQRGAQVRQAVVELGDPAGDLLAERQRRRVLQVGAADLDDVGELPGLLGERRAQRLEGGNQAAGRSPRPRRRSSPSGRRRSTTGRG